MFKNKNRSKEKEGIEPVSKSSDSGDTDLQQNISVGIDSDDMEAMLETSPLFLIKIDPDERIVYINTFAQSLTTRAVLGKSLYEFLDEDCHDIVYIKHKTVFDKNRPQQYEVSATTLEGRKRYYSANVTPVSKDQFVHAAVIVAQDITEQKLYEKALIESEGRYRQLADLTFEGILVHDGGVVVDCNETFMRMSGYTREELIGKNLVELLASESSKTKIYQELAKEDQNPWEFEGITKSGKILPLRLQSRWVNYQGKILRAIALRDISERKQAESELRTLYTAIEQSPSNIVITNPQGQIEYINPAFTRDTGYTLDEVKGENPKILKTDLHEQGYYKNLWETVLNGETWYGEFQNQKKNGEFYWESAVISPVLNENKEVTHILAIKDNTTEQRKAEKALKESEERHRIVSELISDYVYRLDFIENKKIKLSWTSGAFQKISGYTVEEINRKDNNWISIIHEEDVPKILHLLDQIEENASLSFEYRITTKSGEERWLSDHGRPIWDERNEAIIGILGAVQDISEKKKAEQALINSEESMNLLLKTIPDLIFVLDREGRFLDYYTDEKDKLIVAPDLFDNKYFHEVFPPSMSKEFYFYLEKAFNTKELQTYEYTLERDGITYYNESRLIVSGENELVAVIRDITDLKKATTELQKAKNAAEQANKSKSAFLANMSHEIRTPINAVLGFSDLLYSLLKDPVHQGYLKSIISSGNTLLTLLNDILDLSKIEAGKMNIKISPVDLKGIFDEISHIFSLKASQKNLNLIIDISDELPPKVFMDELRLRQILLNLVDNAIKFTEEGFVKVTAQLLSKKKSKKVMYGNILISVEDSGIGINAEDQRKIFKAFVQKDDQDKRKYGGTGLGLAITKRLTEMMGGTISVESILGEGSIFSMIFDKVRIPDDGQYTLNLEIDRKIEKISVDNLNIVIIEPDEINSKLIKEVFSGKNLHFSEYADVNAVENLKAPDLIIISLMEADLEVSKKINDIRRNPGVKKVPIVIITSFDDPEVVKKFGKIDRIICLTKPVDLKVFTEQVNYFLKMNELSNLHLPKTEFDQEGDPYQELIDTLKNKYLKIWKNTKDAASFSSIERFALQISQLGKHYHEEKIINYGKDLFSYTKNFDIDNIHNLLNRFPEIVEGLEKNRNF